MFSHFDAIQDQIQPPVFSMTPKPVLQRLFLFNKVNYLDSMINHLLNGDEHVKTTILFKKLLQIQ